MEMTTTEVMNDLAAADMAGDDYQLFQQYLERCDLVKFAKVIPSEEENNEVIRMAYDIIDRTKIILSEPVHEENEDKLSESTGEQMTPKGDGDQEIVTESDVVNEKPVEEIEKGGDV